MPIVMFVVLCLTSYNYCNKTFSKIWGNRKIPHVSGSQGRECPRGGGEFLLFIYLVGGSLFYCSLLLFVYLFTEGFLVKQRRA